MSTYNKNAGYGRGLVDFVRGIVPTFGRIFVVLNATSDTALPHYDTVKNVFDPDTEGRVRFYTSLSAAYDATYDGNNDVILLDAKTSHKVSSMLTISKSRIHFIGMDGGGRKIGARAMVSNTSTGVTADVAMVYITGTGCSFRNISFKNNWSVAQNLSAVKDYGVQSYFENCDIENLGTAHMTNENAASLIEGGNENIFKNCTIGQMSTLITSTGGQAVIITNRGTTATKCTRTRFDSCRFQTYTSDTTHVFVRAGANAIDRDVTFDSCEFVNDLAITSAATMAVAMATNASIAGEIHVSYPRIFGATNLATSAVGATGVYVVSPVLAAAASDCVGVQAS